MVKSCCGVAKSMFYPKEETCCMVYGSVESARREKHAHMVSLPMGEATHGVLLSCSHGVSPNANWCNQMHFSPTIFVVRRVFAVILWGALFSLSAATLSEAFYTSPSMARYSAYAVAVPAGRDASQVAALHGKASGVDRISTSDLQQRQDNERRIQLAAFQQFDSQKTGVLYNVSVTGIPSGYVRAIRLRSGSFRRYGVNISEFTIPIGGIVDPFPERILLVYTRFPNTTLFQSVPAGYVLASAVLSVLVYDAGQLNSSQPPPQISVSATTSLISIRFPQVNSSKCAYFSDNTTAVTIFDLVQGECRVDHLGTFALVRSGSLQAPPPGEEQTPASPRSKKNSNTVKIIAGSVVGGLALLALVTLLAVGIGKRRKDAKLSRMEYQTEQGETLQMATIRNSRVPTATNTRTQATLVNDYAA
ncbi:hypothetical protein GOP47_0005825 [Adiantum capillus-veneris]|uniref:Transmembrane protein n=1 Tax=Adiantum capillus-veneris TaxID=13818 RepID=A0A9D4V6S8_ADICA|nr:hypothetical protein GOP47_0005825 [Adiantum capillus-veneris]